MKRIQDINRNRNIAALVASILIEILFFIGIAISGGYKLYYFTRWCNILTAVIVFLTIPYEIDGLRKNNFHLPNYVVVLLYIASTGIFFVFLFILTFGLPVYGVEFAYDATGIYFHLIIPLLNLALIQLLIKDHRLAFKDTFLAIIPITCYCIFYIHIVFILGLYDDFYCLAKFVPFWVSVVVLLPIVYGLGVLIRFGHNKIYEKEKERVARYYMECDEFNRKDIIIAIEQMAIEAAPHDHGGEVVIPRRIIALMKEKYQCAYSVEQLCECFLKKYFECIQAEKQIAKK